MRDFAEIAREHLPPVNPQDPTLGVIAHSNPYELEEAMKHVIAWHQGRVEQLGNTETMIDTIWADAARMGQDLGSIHKETYDHLKKTSDTYKATYGEELDVLGASLEHEQSVSMTPPEILGLHPFNADRLQMLGKEQDILAAQAKEIEGEAIFAAATQKRRNQLGRPAKILTWIASAAMLTGIGIRIAKIDITNDKNAQEAPAVKEVVMKGGAITMIGGLALGPVIAVGDSANRRSAKLRAKRKLKKS